MSNKVDLQKIADELDFDLEDIEMLFEVFLSSANDSLDKLEEAIEVNNMDGIFHAAHSLKGSSSNLTLMHIAELAKEIEEAGRAKEVIDYKEKFAVLKQLLKELVT